MLLLDEINIHRIFSWCSNLERSSICISALINSETVHYHENQLIYPLNIEQKIFIQLSDNNDGMIEHNSDDSPVEILDNEKIATNIPCSMMARYEL